jgi:hypothetical protein
MGVSVIAQYHNQIDPQAVTGFIATYGEARGIALSHSREAA